MLIFERVETFGKYQILRRLGAGGMAVVFRARDERLGDAESFVRRRELPWLQGFIGPDSPVVSAYGATAIPATFTARPSPTVVFTSLPSFTSTSAPKTRPWTIGGSLWL